jgi:NitT/TauT family transport system substrate-binding protein
MSNRPRALGLVLATAWWALACAGGAPAGVPSRAATPTAVPPAGPAGAAPGPTTAPPAPEPVRVGSTVGASDAGFFIADEKGYFREQGLSVEITPFASATEIVAPLGNNQLDVGGGAPSAGLGNAIARGIPLKIVADKGSAPPGFGYAGVLIRQELWDSGAIRSVADMRGRRLGINSTAGNTLEAAMDRLLREANLSTADIELVLLPFSDQPGALANGGIDLAFPIEPFVAFSVEQGVAHLFRRVDEFYPGQQIAVVFYGKEFAEQRPEIGRRFMLAYLRAARDYNDAFAKNDPAKRREVVDILVRNTPVKDPAVYDKMAMPGIAPDGRVNLQSLEMDQEYYLRVGKQQQAVDYRQVVDMSFADWATQQLGPYR